MRGARGRAASPRSPLYREGDGARLVELDYPSDSEEAYRTPWRRDYARLIHSAAFRRLQGKTQLFPSHEGDFFRNRLTHSLEVAQIAKSIAIRVNNTTPYFKRHRIDTDLVETAALAHDLGHPPFGHNGEEALNEWMRDAGGFEGNAQTLRILSKLEKRETFKVADGDPDVQESIVDGHDNRAGLNLSYRTLAAILKYDRPIPHHPIDGDDKNPKIFKGYYFTEASVVKKVKTSLGLPLDRKIKTIECSIMDLADDIAYSTYDLEDAFKARFLSPLSMWTAEGEIIENVAKKVKERLDEFYPELSEHQRRFTETEVYNVLLNLVADAFSANAEHLDNALQSDDLRWTFALIAREVAQASDDVVSSGYYRTKFTSDMVGELIRGIKVNVVDPPILSSVRLDVELFKKMEVVKNFVFESIISSARLKVTKHRGKEIVSEIFKALHEKNGFLLMPEDCQHTYKKLKDEEERKRVICDFIAGMTDQYAVNFYSRLYGTSAESIYSPL